MAMKISSDEVLINPDAFCEADIGRLVQMLQSSIGLIAYAINPRLVFTRKNKDEFECWIEANEGVFLSPQMSLPKATAEENYWPAAILIIKQLIKWNKEYPARASLEIPILFR